ncbi:hypothetical protein [Demequina capsici]|uniref:Uncharacterized protein n=1 Tax=Demequina capsici TaxID=3075620 RepID=A0AA96F7R2_9MICO|nr:hypothetical protein [Demequina sp. OYTSA14]WNM25641.1 hypothetical protein RN606_05690 [Demequina sp. OYTSA14]
MVTGNGGLWGGNMWELADTGSGFELRRRGRQWASVAGSIMSVLGAFFALVGAFNAFASGGSGLGYPVMWILFVFVPGLVLLKTVGSDERRRITAITARTEAVGGTVLSLLGEGGLRHDVAVPPDVAARVIESVSGGAE